MNICTVMNYESTVTVVNVKYILYQILHESIIVYSNLLQCAETVYVMLVIA